MGAKPNVVFWGSPEFSLSALLACQKFANILAVVTQPDKERGRGHEVLPTPVKEWGLKNGVRCFSPKSLRKLDAEGEVTMDFLRANPADFFVVVAYGNLLPDAVLALPKRVPVNVHASLLPRWRGAAPIQRALEAGDRVTGVSLQRMVKALDAGDVYLEKKYSILDEDNSQTLFEKLSELGGELIAEFLQNDFAKLQATPQDIAQTTLAPKIDKKEALWNVHWSAAEFHNKVRAFFSWPTVKIGFSDGKARVEVKVLKTKLLTGFSANGSWGVKDGVAFIAGSDGQYTELLNLQVPGKGPVDGSLVLERMQKDKFEIQSA